jgi:hypothetical protein
MINKAARPTLIMEKVMNRHTVMIFAVSFFMSPTASNAASNDYKLKQCLKSDANIGAVWIVMPLDKDVLTRDVVVDPHHFQEGNPNQDEPIPGAKPDPVDPNMPKSHPFDVFTKGSNLQPSGKGEENSNAICRAKDIENKPKFKKSIASFVIDLDQISHTGDSVSFSVLISYPRDKPTYSTRIDPRVYNDGFPLRHHRHRIKH